MSLLEVKGLTRHFGGLSALHELDFEVHRGEILGIIGPNGAGKTTLFNTITGFLKPTRGRVVFDGRAVTGLRPSRIASLGLIRTWQLVNLIGSRTVFENVRVACHLQHRVGVLGSVVRSPSARREEAAVERRAAGLLDSMGLLEVRDETASALPHGRMRMLGLCLALAARPKLLLLDEPAAGLSVAETAAIMTRIQTIRREGVTVMLVEHDMKVIMNSCDRIIVLNFGRKLAEGTPAEISTDEEVVRAYLGFENGNRTDAA